MFEHITPAFIAASVTLFGVMVASPHLRRYTLRNQDTIDRIRPKLQEIQTKWTTQTPKEEGWRIKMNEEMHSVWRRNGLSPWEETKTALFEVAVYLVTWAFFILATADMMWRAVR